MNRLIGSSKQWQQRFAYDSLGRLSSAREFRGDNNQQSYLINYNYDLFGNRYQYQSQNSNNPFSQVWVESGQINQANNRFNSGVTYDDAGNITVDSKFRNLQFRYDANNRQTQSANLDGSGAVVSIYDAGGQRVATQVGGALTNVLVYNAVGKLVAEYGSAPPATGGTQYLFSDHQGSPRAITNSSGAVISRHDYLPYGEDLSAGVGLRSSGQGYAATDGARQKYAGMEGDDATGLAHTLWRQYDSFSGRWTAPDPYGGSMSIASPQSFNRYGYVNNDPVNQVDPSGLMEFSIVTDWVSDKGHGSESADGHWERKLFMPYSTGLRQDPKPPPPATKPGDPLPVSVDGSPMGVIADAGTSKDQGEPVTTSETPLANTIETRPTEPTLEQRQAYYGTWDGVPDEHVAHDNDDFRRFNLTLSPSIFKGFGVSFSFTWDKYHRHYFSVGPSVGLGLPVSASLLTGQTWNAGNHVQDKDGVEKILTGPSASVDICPLICFNGGWNTNHIGMLPLPTGGNTVSSGIAAPNVSYTKDWTKKLWF